MNYKYTWIQSAIREQASIARLVELGFTPEQIKAFFIETLTPYFESTHSLNKYIDILIPDLIVLLGLSQDRTSLRMLAQCLQSYRAAKQADATASLKACSDWVAATTEQLSAYWSMFHLQRDLDSLVLEEFTYEVFRMIGVLIEGPMKPYLKALLHQVYISQKSKISYRDLELLSLGNTVDQLILRSGYPTLFAPIPWSVPLNHWRNIAQHLSVTFFDQEIVCRYGNKSNVSELRLSREDLLAVLRTVKKTFEILKLSKTFFFIDNLDEISAQGLTPNVDYEQMRPEMSALTFSTAIIRHGFELVQFESDSEETVAVVQDSSPMEASERRLYIGQLTFILWQYTNSPLTKVEYREWDGTPNIRVSVSHVECEKVAQGQMDLGELIRRCDMFDLKSGVQVPPIIDGDE